MRTRVFGSLAVLLAGVGSAFAQQPATSAPTANASCPTPGCPPSGKPPAVNPVDGCFTPLEGICGPDGQVWPRAEYLLWWLKGPTYPALVTASPADSRGVLGQNGTVVLFGGDGDNSVYHGGRFTVGGWVDCEQLLGLEISYFFLGTRSRQFDAGGTGEAGTGAVARPFFDVNRRAQNSELIAFPDTVKGTVQVETSTGLQGWAPTAYYNACCDCDYRIDALVGFRYYQLGEQLRVTENLETLAAPGIARGTRFNITDEFETRNYFYGGAVGAQGEYRMGRLFAQGLFSVAFGTTHQIVNVRGSTLVTPHGSTMATVNNGGLLALPSNIGRQTHNQFSVIPEIGFRVGARVTDNVRVGLGYSFLYWNDVVRPGDQVDLSIDPRQLPRSTRPPLVTNATSPAPLFKSTDFWAQGLTLSVELRY